jgi:predicted patatin/cPLA2 family phospholipase
LVFVAFFENYDLKRKMDDFTDRMNKEKRKKLKKELEQLNKNYTELCQLLTNKKKQYRLESSFILWMGKEEDMEKKVEFF